MKRGILGLALLSASGFAHSMSWADLWSRPDQQSIRQREQAYTEIQGEQFAAAAEHLNPFADPVSQYNRGNALAHTGDLQAALSAYDSVLQNNAADADLKRDAQHNRDLVEQQDKSQKQPDKSGNKGDKDQKSNKSSGDGKSDKTPSGDKAQDGKEQGDNGQEKKDQSSKSAGTQNADKSQSPETAQRDPAQIAPGSNSPDAQGQTIPADERPGDASKMPPSEQAQSLDQWLRWIPDDPGGLLRRKFMIEHMQNQRGSQQ
jgi:Ca-activated chloride channel homolog